MKKYVYAIASIFLLFSLALSPVYANTYSKNQLIIKLRDSDSEFSATNIRSNILDRYPVASMRHLGNQNTMSQIQIQNIHQSNKHTPILITFSKDIDIDTLLIELTNDPSIEWAEPNYIFSLPPFESAIIQTQNTVNKIRVGPPNDSLIDEQTSLEAQRAFDAWDVTIGASDIVIAIIDTGVQIDHPDLKDNIWINTDEIPNNGIDDDENGFIDDRNGWSFDTPIGNDPNDLNGHGTHVAGIAAARGDNGTGVAGICFNCSIMALKVNQGSADDIIFSSSIADAIYYAIDNKASVINLSLGGFEGGDSNLIRSAVNAAINADIPVVAAAGNDRLDILENRFGPYIPASYDNVITVSAVQSNGEFDDSYSNFGTPVNIAAVGTRVLSTYIKDQYAFLTGTSMAAPQVAGTIGLMKTVFPELSIDLITQILERSSVDQEPMGRDIFYGAGFLDIASTIDNTQDQKPIISHSLNSGDFISRNHVFSVEITGANNIISTSIEITINDDHVLTVSDIGVTWDGTRLQIDLERFLSTDSSSITIRLSVSDSEDHLTTETFTLYIDESLELTGPNGERSIINTPNPFNPSGESTYIEYQLSQDAEVDIRIYSMNLKEVFYLNVSQVTGYHFHEWNGRDKSGNIVPNGVYILIIKAENGEKEIIKRSKIAVLR